MSLLFRRDVIAVISASAASLVILFAPLNLTLSQSEVVQLHEALNRGFRESVKLGDALYKNTDMMMRFSHYTDSHQPGTEVPFCPECTRGKRQIGHIVSLNQDDLPATDFSRLDLVSDCVEIVENLERHHMAALIQQVTLRRTLTRLRNGKK